MTDRNTKNTIQSHLAIFLSEIKPLVEKPDFSADDMMLISKWSTMFRVHRVTEWLIRNFGDKVVSGLFKGMQLPRFQSGSLLNPKILGTYEMEIHPLISDMARFDTLIDIGSAEGFYAVGCPFVHSHLRSIAYDTDARLHEVCRHAAEANCVSGRIEQRTYCSPEELHSTANERSLVLIDIDGGETNLLCSLPSKGLSQVELIVEVHRSGASTTADTIIPHFQDTHSANIIFQKARDPDQFKLMRSLNSYDKFLALWEGRQNEAWLHLTPKKSG